MSIDLLFTTRRTPRARSSASTISQSDARVRRPVHGDAVLARLRLEALEVAIEVIERVVLDRGGTRAQRLEVGNLRDRGVALRAQQEHGGVVARDGRGVGQRAAGARVEAEAGSAHAASRLRSLASHAA